jgi:single-stranded DNA-binding protein
MTGYLEAAVSGIIVKQPELRTSAKGTKFLGMTLRVGDGDGATFCRVTVFGQLAEDLAPQAEKGARVSAEGALTADIYERDGKATPSLSIAARWARVSGIGKNRPKRDNVGAGRAEGDQGGHRQQQSGNGHQRAPAASGRYSEIDPPFDDQIGF